MFWNKPKWSEYPGCFERHLQRRDGNILFPRERRSVSKDEIEKAKKRDKLDQDKFIESVGIIKKELNNLSILQDTSFLQKVHAMLEQASSIGGNIFNELNILETIQEKIIHCLNTSMPDGKELLKKAKSLSDMERIPYLAQLKRTDTPILKNEEVPTLLSEGYEAIALVGYISRNFPNFKPSESDIITHLENAVRQGFDKDMAQNILKAWHEMQ